MFKKIILVFCLMLLSFVLAEQNEALSLPDGAKIIKRQYGLNIVQKADKLGVFNKDNTNIIPIKYSNLELVSDRIYKAEGKYGAYNYHKTLSDPIFDDIQYSIKGNISAKLISKKGDRYYILEQGETFSDKTKCIIAKDIKPIDYYHIAVKKEDKYALIAFNGTQYSDYIYDDIEENRISSSEKRFIVTKDSKKGLVKVIDDKLITLIEPEYDSFNFDISYNDDYYKKKYKDRNYNIDKIGYAIDAKKGTDRYILRFNEKDELFITKNPVNDDKFTIVKAGLVYKKDGKYGFISLNNIIELKNEFDLIYNPKFLETANYLFLKKDGKYALYNLNQNKRTPYIYDDIYLGTDSLIVATKGQEKVYFNKKQAALRKEAEKNYNIRRGAETKAATVATTLSGGILFPLLIAADAEPAPSKPQEEHPIEYFKDCMQK